MCRRAVEPALGLWALPSGYLECGEALEEGVARETLEETGVDISPGDFQLYSVINMTQIEQVCIAFRAQLDEIPAIVAGPECLEVAFFAHSEIPLDAVAWRGTLGGSQSTFYSELGSGQFAIHLSTLGSEEGRGFKTRRYHLVSILPDIIG